jgi:heat shock protein HtpX
LGEPVLGPLSGLVLLELALLAYRKLALRGKVVDDQTLVTRVEDPVRELCRRAGVTAPRVVVFSNGLRAMAVGRRKGHVLLVASAPFLEGIDDRALRGVVAHELGHLRRDDLRTARLTSGAVLVIGFVAAFLLAMGNPSLTDLPIYTAVFPVVAILCVLLMSPLSRRRELRADKYGAQLSGDPEALSSALVAANRFGIEARRRVFGVGAWRWLLWPMSWRIPSHPSAEKRLAALAKLGATAPGQLPAGDNVATP